MSINILKNWLYRIANLFVDDKSRNYFVANKIWADSIEYVFQKEVSFFILLF